MTRILCILCCLFVGLLPLAAQEPEITPAYREHSFDDASSPKAIAWNHNTATPLLAITAANTLFYVWDVTADVILVEHYTRFPVNAMAWSADDRYIVMGLDNGALLLWDTESWDYQTLNFAETSTIFGVRWSITAENELLVVGELNGENGYAWRINIADPAAVEIITATEVNTAHNLLPPIWNHAETRVVIVADDPILRVFDALNGDLLWDYTAEDGGLVLGSAWSADDRTLLVTMINARLFTFDAASGQRKQMIQVFDDSAFTEYGTWNADESLILVGANTNRGGTVFAWEAGTRRPVFEVEVGQVLFGTFAVNGSTLFTTSQASDTGFIVRVWDFAEFLTP